MFVSCKNRVRSISKVFDERNVELKKVQSERELLDRARRNTHIVKKTKIQSMNVDNECYHERHEVESKYQKKQEHNGETTSLPPRHRLSVITAFASYRYLDHSDDTVGIESRFRGPNKFLSLLLLLSDS